MTHYCVVKIISEIIVCPPHPLLAFSFLQQRQRQGPRSPGREERETHTHDVPKIFTYTLLENLYDESIYVIVGVCVSMSP